MKILVGKTWLCVLLVALAGNGAVHAAVNPHRLISDGAVLQQGMVVPIWGTANDGEKVLVKFQDQEVSTTARAGRWLVKLKPLKPGGPFTMTITGDNTVTVTNLLVGELWLCGGQSNMQFPLAKAAHASQEIAQANYPDIRLFTVPVRRSDGKGDEVRAEPAADVRGSWAVCSPQTAPGFPAVGYFFGRDLHQSLQAPIGLINSSRGSTTAEAWTSEPFLEGDPELKPFIDKMRATDKAGREADEAYQQELTKWKAANDKQVADHLPALPKPKPPLNNVLGPDRAAGLYNGMIAPLIPFAIQGVIWYQGEANAERAAEYRRLFPTLINSWRAAWQREFPFLFVQLPNFAPVKDVPGESTWAELREAQLLTLALPKTAMAVTIDIGDADNGHPLNKQDVGHRLALAAEATVYGQSLEYSGPLYKSMAVHDHRIMLQFTHGDGLVARGDDKLKGFAIAGTDKKFVWAQAKIEGDTVVVWNDAVPNPTAVRYAWADNPVGNLYNKAGLPASPFRTDLPVNPAPSKLLFPTQ